MKVKKFLTLIPSILVISAPVLATVSCGGGKSTEIKVTKVEITKKPTGSIDVGGAFTFESKVSPDDATDKTVKWTVNDTDKATINSAGKLNAIKSGTVTVTATANDGSGKIDSCDVTIVQPVTGIIIQTRGGNVWQVARGKTVQFDATVSPEDATKKDVEWKVVNSDTGNEDPRAEINTNGLLTAKAVGNVVVTATAKDSSETTSEEYSLKIIESEIAVESVSFNESTTSEIHVNEEINMSNYVTVSGTEGNTPTDPTIIWSVTDENGESTDRATIDSNGKLIGKETGPIKVKATSHSDQNKSAEHSMTVKEMETTVTIKGDNAMLNTGTLQLTAEVQTTSAEKGVTWTINDATIASIDQTGKITPVDNTKFGTVTVTATAKADSTKTATYNVDVVKPNTSSKTIEGKYHLDTETECPYYSVEFPNEAYQLCEFKVNVEQSHIEAIKTGGFSTIMISSDVGGMAITGCINPPTGWKCSDYGFFSAINGVGINDAGEYKFNIYFSEVGGGEGEYSKLTIALMNGSPF